MVRSRMPRALFLAVLVAASVPGIAAADTTVFIVRHAERIDGSADALLSPDGRERARLLRDMLRDVPLTAIYSTKYRRTMDTVGPAAEARDLDITVRDADMKALAAEILAARRDGHVLVAGHTNTVPALLAAFGVGEGIDIVDAEYDNLFVVTIDGRGSARLLRLRYGY